MTRDEIIEEVAKAFYEHGQQPWSSKWDGLHQNARGYYTVGAAAALARLESLGLLPLGKG